MSKFKAILATLILIPSLAFAADQCAYYTDQDFRDMLTVGPYSESVEIDSMMGSLSIEFRPDGTAEQHFSFNIPEGSGTIDVKETWNVTNAVLNLHLVSIAHSDTHNKQLNQELDEFINAVKANPDLSVSFYELGMCNGKRSVRSIVKATSLLK
ncbi:MAG: hypothetical protein M3R00_09585 [Pseudomonadota bacterium]|nr:hypothetical protein [Pseudomonadota bacterium]